MATVARDSGSKLDERTVDVAGVDTFVRSAGSGAVPLICVHGNPDSGRQWLPLLERAGSLGRVIAPDLPGWGRSERPPAERFDGTMDAHVDWFAALLDALEVDRYRLLVHDWGGLALSAAARHGERVERIAVVDAVPLWSTYRWHWIARIWRTRRLGEASMPTLGRAMVKLLTRAGRARFAAMPDWWLDDVAAGLDAGCKQAILRLYRSADPDVLARHGERLGELRCPALVVWGEKDPYVGVDHAHTYARELGGPAAVEVVPAASHWCMVDSPQVFDRLVAFLS